jgi:hypothetical protein
MSEFVTPIIPTKQVFTGYKDELDFKAICIFSAIGFFLDDDTYYKGLKTLRPASIYTKDSYGNYHFKESYFKWTYNPVDRSLKDFTDEFAELFEILLKKNVGGKKVILPLSGGLDSRTLACGLSNIGADVNSYSYMFLNGHDEVSYSRKIAEVCKFPFNEYIIPSGYLWSRINDISRLNECYADFTHPRQLAWIDRHAELGEQFVLGHWGDVLFDNMGVSDNLSIDERVQFLKRSIIKKGGLELASALWNNWSLDGKFEDYLDNRLANLLKSINIGNSANAQLRAFKSLYWASRWTSVNLSVFSSVRPIYLPYYENAMCQFVCSVPEKFLADRQIQIEYLKSRGKKLAKIEWQSHRPFNLYTYKYNRFPFNTPFRVSNVIKGRLSSKRIIQRNWELQFVGDENDRNLRDWLFNNEVMSQYISPDLVKNFYQRFSNGEDVKYSHAVSTLLTISAFFKNQFKINKA